MDLSGKCATIVWFRRDLRLHDNPALRAAERRGGPVLPVFIWAPGEEEPWAPGAASRWWLHHSLKSLAGGLSGINSRLLLRRGPTLEALRSLIGETGATAVFWNRLYEPAIRGRDAAIENALSEDGVETGHFNAALLFEPGEIQTKQGGPYKVFTPYWKACLKSRPPGLPKPAPKSLAAPEDWPGSLALSQLKLLPQIDWAEGLRGAWQPGETAAISKMNDFSRHILSDYLEGQNRPGHEGTSRLSPHLHFGEISPRRIWQNIEREISSDPSKEPDGKRYQAELGWREFAHHLLVHFPHTTDEPLRPKFKNFAWNDNPTLLKAWQRGRTGYPIVDAGMRELWRSGWMHNRARMITASFLVKDLRIHWREGARWFWDTLVDANLANNTLGWQWTAGCGADAAPYFRIFNPVLQGEEFDSSGAYIRQWIPELAAMPGKWIHKPWLAPESALGEAEVELGADYPRPIVNHDLARKVALMRFAKIKRS